MINNQIQQFSSPECFDSQWKYLFNEQIKVQKQMNILSFMTNTRFVMVEDNIISYKNQENAISKKQVKAEDCDTIEFIKNGDFVLQLSFKECFCFTNTNQGNSNSQKIITWRFIVKDLQEKKKLQQKLGQYEFWNSYFQRYLLASSQSTTNKREEFYQQFYLECKNLISQNQINKDIPKIKRIHFKGESQETFKFYKRLFQIISISSFEELIIPPLTMIIIENNYKYKCELDVLDSKRDKVQNDKIQNKWKLIKQQNQNETQFLNQFKLETYQTNIQNQIKNFGILFYTKSYQNHQINQTEIEQDQLKYLEQQEIFDSLILSQVIHANKFKIRQIGSIANKTTNQDLKKICKAEILARTAKQFFFENISGQNIEEEKYKIELKKFVSIFWALYNKEMDQNKIFQKTKQSFNYTINEKEIIDLLLLNSLMFHLNFFVPINISALLDKKKRFLSCIDFEQIKLIAKYKTFDGVKQLGLDNCEILNYSYIKKYANQNLKQHPGNCYLLAKFLMGQKNLIFIELLVRQQNKDQIFLIRALECLKSVHPNSNRIQLLQQLLSVPCFITNFQTFQTECTIVQSSLQQSILQNEVSQLIRFDETTFNISKFVPIQDENLLIQEANKKLMNQKYAEAHKILELVQNKNDLQILKLGFEIEQRLPDVTIYFYQNRLLNHIFLYNDCQKEKEIILSVLKVAGNRYLKTCTRCEIVAYNQISFNFKKCCQKQLNIENFILQIQQQFFSECFSTLEEYICQQFDQFESLLNKIYLMTTKQIEKSICDLMDDQNFLHANYLYSQLD